MSDPDYSFRRCLLCSSAADAQSTNEMDVAGVASCSECFTPVRVYAEYYRASPMAAGSCLKAWRKNSTALIIKDVRECRIGTPILYKGEPFNVRSRWNGSSIILINADNLVLQLGPSDIPYMALGEVKELQESLMGVPDGLTES